MSTSRDDLYDISEFHELIKQGLPWPVHVDENNLTGELNTIHQDSNREISLIRYKIALLKQRKAWLHDVLKKLGNAQRSLIKEQQDILQQKMQQCAQIPNGGHQQLSSIKPMYQRFQELDSKLQVVNQHLENFNEASVKLLNMTYTKLPIINQLLVALDFDLEHQQKFLEIVAESNLLPILSPLQKKSGQMVQLEQAIEKNKIKLASLELDRDLLEMEIKQDKVDNKNEIENQDSLGAQLFFGRQNLATIQQKLQSIDNTLSPFEELYQRYINLKAAKLALEQQLFDARSNAAIINQKMTEPLLPQIQNTCINTLNRLTEHISKLQQQCEEVTSELVAIEIDTPNLIAAYNSYKKERDVLAVHERNYQAELAKTEQQFNKISTLICGLSEKEYQLEKIKTEWGVEASTLDEKIAALQAMADPVKLSDTPESVASREGIYSQPSSPVIWQSSSPNAMPRRRLSIGGEAPVVEQTLEDNETINCGLQ